MTKEEFNNLKVGDLVYAQIVDTNEWQLCYIYAKSKYSADLMTTTVVKQEYKTCDTVLCKSSVTRTPEEILPMDYFIENNLIRDDSDGWSLKYQIYKDKC